MTHALTRAQVALLRLTDTIDHIRIRYMPRPEMPEAQYRAYERAYGLADDLIPAVAAIEQAELDEISRLQQAHDLIDPDTGEIVRHRAAVCRGEI